MTKLSWFKTTADDMLPTRVSGRERKAARVNEIHHLPVKGGSKYVRITDRPDYVGPPYLRDSDSENSGSFKSFLFPHS